MWHNVLNKYLTSGNDCKILNWFIKIDECIDPEGEGILTNLSILNMSCYCIFMNGNIYMWINILDRCRYCHSFWIWAVNKTWTNSGSDRALVRIGLRIRWDSGSDWTGIFASGAELLFCWNNNDTGGACITRLRIYHQLENHRKELFSAELQWEIFFCIT